MQWKWNYQNIYRDKYSNENDLDNNNSIIISDTNILVTVNFTNISAWFDEIYANFAEKNL